MDVDKDFEIKVTRAVNAVVMGELDDAYTAFRANPGGAGFTDLENAMWAAQYIKQHTHEEWIQKMLPDVPVAKWIEAIVREAKGQFNRKA